MPSWDVEVYASESLELLHLPVQTPDHSFRDVELATNILYQYRRHDVTCTLLLGCEESLTSEPACEFTEGIGSFFHQQTDSHSEQAVDAADPSVVI